MECWPLVRVKLTRKSYSPCGETGNGNRAPSAAVTKTPFTVLDQAPATASEGMIAGNRGLPLCIRSGEKRGERQSKQADDSNHA